MMMYSAIHSRLTWRQAMNADIEADGAALVVITQTTTSNRRRTMKIKTNVKAGQRKEPVTR